MFSRLHSLLGFRPWSHGLSESENVVRSAGAVDPRIIPVLDVCRGQVVHAVAGRRDEYRPIVSRLVASTEPLTVADAMRQCVGTTEIYLADLDAIAGGSRQLVLIGRLAERGYRVWVDAGLHWADEAKALFDVGADVVIAGLETLEVIEEIGLMEVDFHGRVAVSFDMRDGQPVVRDKRFRRRTADQLACELVGQMGVQRLILLDLARVGTSKGPGMTGLCRRLRAVSPTLQLVIGGGVRGPEDLPPLADCGADAVLVATALHQGRFSDVATNRVRT